ncbi:gluconate 2-dehydrogenase subunit 3 family protein [Trinickia violacea]|uniref:Gluconate 2-dehydrogenase subunit 3 family protein n=1 Tax=Trinickia violacea TaxID=2571746 RepID=A0A4P8IZT1_9BURK|nr:gluconate 2-dehydrogenase subunit 3 family protein [Trinickia violacea]QCP53113.1 gluconate 2-dehydrogenase subunit 3 family protein [Trinickia violacea]
MSDTPEDGNNRRRRFLQQVATVSGALPFNQALVAGAAVLASPALAQQPARTAAPTGPKLNNVLGYNSFSPDEAAFVETMVNVMCPADQYTPNGVDCGLAIYIDRQLAGAFGQGAKRYLRGPFGTGRPEQGPQLPLTPEQHFKAGIAEVNAAARARANKTFDQFSPAEADDFLHDLAGGKVKGKDLDLAYWFNSLVYPLFTQACFADPIYGGNFDKVFWRMIGYPGLPATHAIDMVQYRGKPYPGAKDPKSIADFS